MTQRVGRITLAVALIVMGAVLIVDTWLNTSLAWFAARFWPGLIILLGVEWLAASSRAEERPRVDGGAIVLLLIVSLVAANTGAWSRSPFRQSWTVNVPAVTTVPPIPPVPPVTISPPIFFGTVSQEVVQVQEKGDLVPRELVVDGVYVGDIRVEQGDTFRVELRVTGHGRDREEALRNAERVRLDVQPGDTTRVQAELPDGRNQIGLSFLITVPSSTQVNLQTASGSIAVIDRAASVLAQTASGSIHVVDIGGDADLRSASGSITAEKVGGNVAATSSSGRIDVTDVGGAVKLNATSGSIIVEDAAGSISAQSSSGSITVETDRVGGDYDLLAVSGSISLGIPDEAGVNVTARATSGTVSGPDWLAIGEGRGSGAGIQGDGRYQISLRTSSGSIRVETD